MRLFLRTLPIALAALAPLNAALAADYDPPMVVDLPEEEYVPVEVGNGWYLRGDIGYKVNEPYRNADLAISPIFAFEEDRLPVNATIGFGYRFTDYLRLEANLGFMNSDSATLNYNTFTGGALFSTVGMSTENEMWTGMINAYADLGTFVGFTPYVGAGIGAAYYKRGYTFSENFVDPTSTDVAILDARDQYVFAYSLGAGVSYAVSRNLSVDLGYEYFNTPDAEYVTMISPTTFALNTGVDYHQIKLGFRYALW